MVFPNRFKHIIAYSLILLFISVPAWPKGQVNLSRIFKEHKIHIVTTEKYEDISKYLFNLNIKPISVITVTELLTRKNAFKDGESIFYVIDRKKARRLIPEEESRLPCPTSAIEQNQVLVYAVKAKGRNGWDVLVSAPAEKWLHWEMNRLCNAYLIDQELNEKGSILDRYFVKRLCVISNESKEIAENWIKKQIKPGGDTIDWDFIEAENFSERLETDTLFILNRARMNDNCSRLLKHLPENIQKWYEDPESWMKAAFAKHSVQGPDGTNYKIFAAIAPSQRHLKMALNARPTLDSFSDNFEVQRFADLGIYRDVIVIARSSDRNDDKASEVNDLAGKMAASLAAYTGFQCISRQDLKELIYMALLNDKDGTLDSNKLLEIRSQAGNAVALAIADMAALNTETTYKSNNPVCLTEPYPPFSKPEPVPPTKPDPEDRKFGLFGGHKYSMVNGSRANDPNYIRDLQKYYEELQLWANEYKKWLSEYEQYERARDYHDMTWELSVDSTQKAAVTGNLRIYDLGRIDKENAGKLIFTCPLKGEAVRESRYWSKSITVLGENNRPRVPNPPDAHNWISDKTIVSDALVKACETAVGTLMESAILPIDEVARPISEKGPQSNIVSNQRVQIEQVGIARRASKPVGKQVDAARAEALADACAKLMKSIKNICPGSAVTEDEIKRKARIVSEGWTAKTKEYRVRIIFEANIEINLNSGN